MPHLTIECSANVRDVTDLHQMARALHAAAIETGVAPLDGLRTRVVVHELYVIADERPENKFIAVSGRFLQGRSLDDKRTMTQALMDALVAHLGDDERDVSLSVEFNEIDADTRLNRNTLKARLENQA
jgi:5-carboxymethyl-2-hydroxymuconate isomerase